MASQAVTELLSLFKSSPELVSAPTQVWRLSSQASFARPEVDTHEDPYVVFARLSYKSGGSADAVKGFGRVCDYAKSSEPGCLDYNVLQGSAEDEADEVRTLEVYESERYLWDVHAKSEVVKRNIDMQSDMRLTTDLTFLKKVKGYFRK